jgi:hypothetical protein
MACRSSGIRARSYSKTKVFLRVQAAAAAALMLLAVPLPGWAKRKMNPDQAARIELIRSLSQEVAVTKIALPRGKHGILVDAQGQVEKEKADAEMRRNGVAIRPGMPVKITKMEFKSRRVILELNGGGKKGKKWYQRIEVGMGTTTRPVTPQTPTLAYGSSITLAYDGKVADLTVPQVKQMLAAVLDFDRHSPTVLYSPIVPPEIKAAIKNHQVIVGMERDAVLSSKGAPDRKVREERDGVEQEDWIYGLPPHVLFVTFDGDIVVKVTQY